MSIKSDATSADKITEDYRSWSMESLADHIQNKHHRYVEEVIPVLRHNLNKLCTVHGEQHPELFSIAEIFNQSASELLFHMKKEEIVLFPYIREMVRASTTGDTVAKPAFKTIEMPVEMMLEDHRDEVERFEKIAELSDNYTTPLDACGTYQATFEMLSRFEDDLRTHIYLENEILFPRAVAIEKSLVSQS